MELLSLIRWNRNSYQCSKLCTVKGRTQELKARSNGTKMFAKYYPTMFETTSFMRLNTTIKLAAWSLTRFKVFIQHCQTFSLVRSKWLPLMMQSASRYLTVIRLIAAGYVWILLHPTQSLTTVKKFSTQPNNVGWFWQSRLTRLNRPLWQKSNWLPKPRHRHILVEKAFYYSL